MEMRDMGALIRKGLRRVIGLIALAMGLALAGIAFHGVFISHTIGFHNGLGGFIVFGAAFIVLGWYWVRGEKYEPECLTAMEMEFALKNAEQKIQALNWIIWLGRMLLFVIFVVYGWIAYAAYLAGVPIDRILAFSAFVALGILVVYRLRSRKIKTIYINDIEAP